MILKNKLIKTAILRGFVSSCMAVLAISVMLGLSSHASSLDERATSNQHGTISKNTIAKTTLATLVPLDAHPRTSRSIVEQLRHHHYLTKPLDDNTSSQIFDKYLGVLDRGRVYFLNTDIQEMEKYRYELDDALRDGDLKPAFEMFNLYQLKLINRLEFLLQQLDQGLDNLNFNLEESIAIDREEAPWAKDQAELDDLWRKRLKASVIGSKLNDKELSEIQETLTKRYKNRLKQAKRTKSEDAFQLYVNAYAATYDPHTQYFSPRISENFNINMSLSLDGIGAVLKTEDDYTVVVRLIPAGPADKSTAIKATDRILAVGQGENSPLIDVIGWRLDDVVELIRGPKGSVVRLEVKPNDDSDGANKVISITRNTVKLEEQSAQKKLLTLNQGGVEHKIGVIEIPTFYLDFKARQNGDPEPKSTTRDVERLLQELKDEGAEALVIDLRNNGGGSLEEADKLTGIFIDEGPTVQIKLAKRSASVHSDKDGRVAWDKPLAVLVNRLSASASEIFAGAIQDYGRGLVIGSQTFGKGTVQTLVPLNRGQLKITQAKFYRISGGSTQHQGVVPDIEFPELYDVDRIGESSLEGALPYDTIKPASYHNTNELNPLLGSLQAKHASRTKNNPDFQYLRAFGERNIENRKKTHISLNEAQRTQEKLDDDAWRLGLENQLRIAKGKTPVASLDELEAILEAKELAKTKAESAADIEKTNSNANPENNETTGVPADPVDGKSDQLATGELETGDKEELDDEEDNDALTEESARILLDYIKITRQMANLDLESSDSNIARLSEG
ncbi:MAG: carboxy terminal-processing peptidase [Pseudomonadales bacterium]|nr:carboxy terminal-processing peptidase [Pseudomonadales bacterium]